MEDIPRHNIVQTVKEYGEKLFGFIRKKVNSDEDAEDILQDVWYQLSNVLNINEIETMSGWLYQVARNKIIDKYRRKSVASFEDRIDENDEASFILHDILLTDNFNPETEALNELLWKELFIALNELPENQRQVFIWNELEDMTLQQIADQTGENIKTIISRKGYAVKHLRRALASIYNEILIY